MAGWNPRGQSYTLPTSSVLGTNNTLPVSSSNIGNVYSIAQAQSVPISVESSEPRKVTLSNVGSIPLIVTDTQRSFPFGLRLPSGDLIELFTRSALWVSAPPSIRLVSGRPGIVPTIGYASVSVAI